MNQYHLIANIYEEKVSFTKEVIFWHIKQC